MAGAAIAAAIAFVLVLASTRHGIGILPDSTRYMGMNDVPYDAPLYAWLLMLLSHAGIGMAAGAKLLGLVLSAANAALTWYLLARTTGRTFAAAIGTGLIVLSPQFVDLHSSALSEPLFLFFFLAIYIAFLNYLESERVAWLVIAALLTGLCSLVRFTAPPIGFALAATLLISRRHPWPRRLRDAAILSLIAGGLFAGWCVASQLTAGQSLGRELSFHGNMGAMQWMKSLEAMAAWLLPDQVSLAARVGILATVAIAGAYIVGRTSGMAIAQSRWSKVAEPLLPMALGLFFLAYVAFMVLATSIEANLSLTGRYAFPLYVSAVLMISIAASMRFAPDDRVRRVITGLACLAIIVLCGHLIRTALRTKQDFQNGKGFAAPSWTGSPTLRHVAALPPQATIWSNAPDAVAYVTGHKAHWLPWRVMPRTGLPDPAHPYAAQVEQVRQSLRTHEGYLVFMRHVEWRPYLATETRLVSDLNLQLVANEPDGRVYAAALRDRTSRPIGKENR